MTDASDDLNSPPHRRTFEASGDDIEVRQNEESGIFELRMPIASTGEVRNENDDPLTRDEVDGMARQINDGSLTVGVFVDHGQTDISGAARYSIAERVGEWQEADVTTRDNGDAELLDATARMMDPDSLPDIPVRGHLGTVKELAVRDMSVPASIGWADDEDAPGGVDLMEASVVGIQADKRTHSEASAEKIVARAAVEAGAEPDDLMREIRTAIGAESACPDSDNEMSENTESAEGSQADQEQEEQTDEQRADMNESINRLVDLQEEQTDMLREMKQAMDDDKDGEDGEDDDDNEEEEGENAANGANNENKEQSAGSDETNDKGADDELRNELEDLREQLKAVREGGLTAEDVDVPGDDPDGEERETDEQTDEFGEDAVKSLIK
jgi:hypothetical protein